MKEKNKVQKINYKTEKNKRIQNGHKKYKNLQKKVYLPATTDCKKIVENSPW